MNLVFATQNINKAREIQALLPDEITIQTLADIECFDDIPETSKTLEGNASLKSKYVVDNFEVNCFADDTGLEINELNGEPGVYSARYAGSEKSADLNMNLVLEKLEGKEDRSARFRTVISLIIDGVEYLFEGIVEGVITESKSGKEGFGYDPIFKPNGFDRTFSEMSMEEKNTISHRGKAIQKLIEFLKNV